MGVIRAKLIFSREIHRGCPRSRDLPGVELGDRQEANLPGVQQQRQQEKREQKLKDIREQVAEGKLVIRAMTAEERARFPRREATPTRRGGKRR